MVCMLPCQACWSKAALQQLRIELWHVGCIENQSDSNDGAELEFEMGMLVSALKLTALCEGAGRKALDLTICISTMHPKDRSHCLNHPLGVTW